jgi:hypothetical protein
MRIATAFLFACFAFLAVAGSAASQDPPPDFLVALPGQPLCQAALSIPHAFPGAPSDPEALPPPYGSPSCAVRTEPGAGLCQAALTLPQAFPGPPGVLPPPYGSPACEFPIPPLFPTPPE